MRVTTFVDHSHHDQEKQLADYILLSYPHQLQITGENTSEQIKKSSTESSGMYCHVLK
jgi:hypothetical protein